MGYNTSIKFLKSAIPEIKANPSQTIENIVKMALCGTWQDLDYLLEKNVNPYMTGHTIYIGQSLPIGNCQNAMTLVCMDHADNGHLAIIGGGKINSVRQKWGMTHFGTLESILKDAAERYGFKSMSKSTQSTQTENNIKISDENDYVVITFLNDHIHELKNNQSQYIKDLLSLLEAGEDLGFLRYLNNMSRACHGTGNVYQMVLFRYNCSQVLTQSMSGDIETHLKQFAKNQKRRLVKLKTV